MPLRIVASSPGRPEWVEAKAGYDAEGIDVPDEVWACYQYALAFLATADAWLMASRATETAIDASSPLPATTPA